jgi:hypothetical protein
MKLYVPPSKTSSVGQLAWFVTGKMDAQGRRRQKFPKIRGSTTDAGYCHAESAPPCVGSDGPWPQSPTCVSPKSRRKARSSDSTSVWALANSSYQGATSSLYSARISPHNPAGTAELERDSRVVLATGSLQSARSSRLTPPLRPLVQAPSLSARP